MILRNCLLILLVSYCCFSVAADKNTSKKKDTTPPLHHVFENIKLPDNFEPPATMPLGKNRALQCETCHGIKDMEDIDFDKVDKEDPDFLRGGPYQELNQFCSNCHKEKAYQRPNIHVMLDENGEIIKEHCKYCHTATHKRDKALQADELKLRIPADQLCFGCHLKSPHLNAIEHQVEPEKERLELMKKSAKKHQIILPLSMDGKVMCVTCHTPHPSGMLEADLPAAKQIADAEVKDGIKYRKSPWNEVILADKQGRLDEFHTKSKSRFKAAIQYQQIDKEVLLRLPAKDGTLCLACHEFDE